MPDYPKLYARLWREIQQRDGQLDSNAAAFVRDLVVKLKQEGWQLGPESEQALTAYLAGVQSDMREGLNTALGVASAYSSMRSEQVAAMTEAAFTAAWPDGLTLSERLWKFEGSTRRGITDTLRQGIRQGAAVDRIVMDMQRSIERSSAGERFKIVERQFDDWVKDLHKAAQDLIHDPGAKKQWDETVELVEDHVRQLAATGSRSAAERLLSQIRTAVADGNEELLDKAVKWWVYDKQLYNLKRIARTEMATAAHRAVIASTVDDPDVIGYQWRLSSSHPRPDICDYYANIDMGLGKGVWNKDAVPHEKAHPHCMCLLIPRVTQIKRKGSHDYREFIDNSSDEMKAKLLPAWVRQLMQNGVPLHEMIRPDGNWTMTRREMIAKLGEDQFNALSENKPI